MNIHVHQARRLPEEEIISLSGEALTNSSPPLSDEAVWKIGAIKNERLAMLEGSDRYVTIKIYEAIDKLPPIEGVRIQKFLLCLSQTDFSLDSVKRVMALCSVKEGEGHPYQRADEWGFLNEKVKIDDREGNTRIILDVERAAREGNECFIVILASLLSIDEQAVKIAVAEDCCKIIDLRLHFQFD